MKSHYDKKSVIGTFHQGDKVLVLLPVPGSILYAQFSGPYLVEQGELMIPAMSNYVELCRTPDRKQKSRVCHINTLKHFFTRDCDANCVSLNTPAVPVPVCTVQTSYHPSDDGLIEKSAVMPVAHSEVKF